MRVQSRYVTNAVSELFYNFKIAGVNCGYSYLNTDASKLYSFTRFLTKNGELFTNVFNLKLEEERVLACKHGELDWVDLSEHPPNHFPGCAYPLLLARAVRTPLTYIQISESDGSIIDKTQMEREASDIVESQNSRILRRFTMVGETPVRIDWGGAISQLCSNGKECVLGTDIEFVIE